MTHTTCTNSKKHTQVCVYSLNETFLSGQQCSLQELRSVNTSHNTSHEKPSFELLARVTQETENTIAIAIAIAFGLAPEVEGKSLLRKTPCTSDTWPRGPDMEQAKKAPF